METDIESQSYYKTRDGNIAGTGMIVINVSGILLFGGLACFAIYIMCRFYRHKSYSIGLFYIASLINLAFRAAYFITLFFTESAYANVVFLCTPSSFSCSIGLC